MTLTFAMFATAASFLLLLIVNLIVDRRQRAVRIHRRNRAARTRRRRQRAVPVLPAAASAPERSAAPTGDRGN